MSSGRAWASTHPGGDDSVAVEGAGTRLVWRQSFDSASVCESVRRFAVPANEENLDRLEVELARTSP